MRSICTGLHLLTWLHYYSMGRHLCNYIHILQDVVERLKCFAKYPRKVKQELARVIYYENVEAGRVIIQQGHIGMSFYFIVSGAVVVKMQERDKETGQYF